jgi:CubicO group peptidase (beta-lactamase class C family)/pimeloyl-ACP methyl ester carboxylesterase
MMQPLAALLLCLSGALSAAEGAIGELAVKPYEFVAEGGRVSAEYGVLTVPENREHPRRSTVELAFVRFPSTAENPGPPIVYLAGGPGTSGIETARGPRFPVFQALRQVGDVIALDQRGVGDSRPSLYCDVTWQVALDCPLNRSLLLESLRPAVAEARQQLESRGINLASYNTRENAADLEDLRRALGVEKINLWAISYGTHLALAMMRQYPDSVHRAILAGVEGPAHSVKLPSQIDANLDRLHDLLLRDPVMSRQIPDLRGLVRRVLDQYEENPRQLQVQDPRSGESVVLSVGKTDLQALTAKAMGNQQALRRLPLVYQQLEQGRLDLIEQHLVQQRHGRIGNAMRWVMDAASGISAQRWRRVLSESEKALFGRWIDFPFPDVNAWWGVPDLGEEFRSPVRSATPVLFISGTLDGRTPPRNAEEVATGFPNHRHLVLHGASHSDPLFLSSPKIREVMQEFLSDRPLSATDIELPPMEFVSAPAERTTRRQEFAVAVDLLRDLATGYCSDTKIPGMAVAVSHRGKLIFEEAFGFADLAARKPAARDTLFRIASISKSLTGTCLARLLEQGILALDDPVQEYVPDFPEAAKPLTIRHLATHQSGIRHTHRHEVWERQKHYLHMLDAVEMFRQDPLLHASGEAFSYTTLGYTLLGAAIEGATGQSYRDVMSRELFDVLDLRQTVADDPEVDLPQRSACYYVEDDETVQPTPELDHSYKLPGGGFLATAGDLARFGAALLQPGYLTQASLDALFEEHWLLDEVPTGYALGWNVGEDPDGRYQMHHSGNQPGGHSLLLLDPESQLVAAFLCNIRGAPFGSDEMRIVLDPFQRALAGELRTESLTSSVSATGEYQLFVRDEDGEMPIQMSILGESPVFHGWIRAPNARVYRLVAGATTVRGNGESSSVFYGVHRRGMVRVEWDQKGRAVRGRLFAGNQYWQLSGSRVPSRLEGWAHADAQRTERAFEVYAQLLRIDPDDGEAHYALGIGNLQRGDPEVGIEHLLRAADLDFLAVKSLYEAASAQARLGDAEESLETLRLAMDAGFTDRRQLESEADFRILRRDPRFRQLLQALPRD